MAIFSKFSWLWLREKKPFCFTTSDNFKTWSFFKVPKQSWSYKFLKGIKIWAKICNCFFSTISQGNAGHPNWPHYFVALSFMMLSSINDFHISLKSPLVVEKRFHNLELSQNSQGTEIMMLSFIVRDLISFF